MRRNLRANAPIRKSCISKAQCALCGCKNAKDGYNACLMDIDSNELLEKAKEGRDSHLNTWIAVVVALLATFMGICKVKDDNIVQAMQQAQADRLDHWSWYQSLHLREEIEAGKLEQLQLSQQVSVSEKKAIFDAPIANSAKALEHIKQRKEEMSAQAKTDQERYDKLNYSDDQFDLSDAFAALAISLLAISLLVQKQWLFGIALVPAVLGLLMGLSGLLGWHIHPDAIVSLLT
jgi:hypothetical protein